MDRIGEDVTRELEFEPAKLEAHIHVRPKYACRRCKDGVSAAPLPRRQLGAGGFPFPGPWGVSVSSNITPHPEDGIAGYADAELKRVISIGLRPDGSRLMPPMGLAYYRNISDSDLKAIIAYLRALEPVPSPE